MESNSKAPAGNGSDLLYEVSKVITSNLFLEQILKNLVELIAQQTGSKICSMMLLDEKKQYLQIKATQSLSKAYSEKPPLKVSQSLSGRALVEKKPVTALDVTREPSYQYPEIAREIGIRSVAVIPMISANTPIGVINCYTEEEHAFSEDELQKLTVVANLAALAITNTRLADERDQAYEQLETRKKVEKAKGIIMKRQNVPEDVAYRLLQKTSMDRRVSIGEVADIVIVADGISPNSK